jgi:hypothetical protein
MLAMVLGTGTVLLAVICLVADPPGPVLPAAGAVVPAAASGRVHIEADGVAPSTTHASSPGQQQQ